MPRNIVYSNKKNGEGSIFGVMNIAEETEKVQAQLKKISTRNDRIGNVKIAIIVVGIALFLKNQKGCTTIGWCILAVLCLLLIYLFLLHARVCEKKEYLEARYQVLEKYNLRSTEQWKEFKDTGMEYLTEHSYLERDLDILGEKSLFQYLCVANTIQGKRKLAEYLTQSKLNLDEIKERSAAVKELIQKFEFRLKFETLGYLSKQKTKSKTGSEWYYNFMKELETDNTESSWIYHIIRFMPLLSIVFFLFAYQIHSNYEIVLLLLLLQMIIPYYISYKYRTNISRMEQFCLGLQDIIGMVECIDQEPFHSQKLKKLKKGLNEDVDLMPGLIKLSRLKEKFSVRRNVYVHVVLQMFLMYDLQCIIQLIEWKKAYGNNLKKILDAIGEVEALLSLGVIAFNREVAFAEVDESDKPVFCAKEIYHPLIEPEKVVSNSIHTTKGINIITGSNMSGKSTFMRTIGINLVLAYAGAPVCAKEMQVSLMNIYTCMRVTDDVFQGKSSFYAEVLRIKTIIDSAKENKPVFIIIDEIFKGTNSIDRITGAKAIIKRLDKPHVMLWVSTHDLEICSLIEEKQVQGNNYHFLETYRDDKLLFDYKIKEGKCMSTNAKYILKMAGLFD